MSHMNHHYEPEFKEKLDEATAETVRALAELCYKEGYKDGMRFMDWLQETTH